MKKYFKKAWFLNIIVSIILIGAYLYDKDVWQHLFVFLLAYISSRLFSPYMGGTQKVLMTHESLESYKYLGYLVSIVITAIIVSLITGFLQKWVNSLQGFKGILFPTLILVGLVYLNYWITLLRFTKE